jgi:ParB family chromosome partitioning protein
MSSDEKKELFSGKTFDQMLGLDDAPPEGTPLELDIDSLLPFPNQPFRPYQEEEMEKMVQSIRENGVISPIVVRPKEDGTYEIISGHNRVEACRRAGFTYVPSFIRDVDEDTAVILMVDSNLRQREKILPIERAKALQMKLEAIKRQGSRTDLTSAQVGRKLNRNKESREIVADSSGMSRNQVSRFIRLNKLIPSLQGAVNKGSLAFNPAVEISYLDPADQAVVQEVMEREETAPSLSQAQKLKKMAQDGSITDKRINDVLTVEKPMYETITFRFNTIEKFFPAGTTGKQMEQKIYEWMEQYRRKWQAREEKAQEQER